MADNRRRRWIALDVHVVGGTLGSRLRERFGPIGVLLWVSYLTACKTYHVEGRVKYRTDVDCLHTFGLPGLELVNEEGAPFTLDEFWTFLGRQKQVKRTRSGAFTEVRCTRWGEWQQGKRRRDAETQLGKSEAEIGDQMPPDTDHDIDNDNDQDKDPDNDSQSPWDTVEFWDSVWSEYANRVTTQKANNGGFTTSREAFYRSIMNNCAEHAERARKLMTSWELTPVQLGRVLAGEESILRHAPRRLEEAS